VLITILETMSCADVNQLARQALSHHITNRRDRVHGHVRRMKAADSLFVVSQARTCMIVEGHSIKRIVGQRLAAIDINWNVVGRPHIRDTRRPPAAKSLRVQDETHVHARAVAEGLVERSADPDLRSSGGRSREWNARD